ncbi:MAG: NYN domain-containing protein [Thermoleophilia bacterium]
MIYIIDAYNVMHFQEEGDIPAGELEFKRDRFIEKVVSFTAAEGTEAIVVFDSRRSKEPDCRQLPHTRVTVCFASRQMIADVLIGKLVQEKLRSQEGRIRVVSADWEVQRGAMQERVERMHPRNFLSGNKNIAKKLAIDSKNDKIRWKLEHSVDEETLKKLEDLRRGKGKSSESN